MLFRARFFSVCLCVLALRSVGAQASCHAADRNSAHFIQTVKAMMDSSQSGMRAQLQLPVVAASQIVLVADTTVCARAGLAADSLVRVWNPDATFTPGPFSLYVIQVGTSYAVVDKSSPPAGEFDWVFFFGPLWEYRGAVWM